MFKRFSSNYMAMLFIIDGLLIQFALWLALEMRYLLPLGPQVRPEWADIYFYSPTLALHLVVGCLWLISFLAIGVYTPRKIIRWYDETQHILLAHTIAALSLAGLLYLANVELLRLVYVYFYVIALVGLISYRWTLRYWHGCVAARPAALRGSSLSVPATSARALSASSSARTGPA
ncbi:MAG: hypothetical protein R2838_25760 [Caldilineaceae bacterium]